MKHAEVSKEIIEGIRKNWPKLFPDAHKPPINGLVVSIDITDPIGNSIIKDITIMDNRTEWNIVMCDEEVMDYGIKMPDPDIVDSIFYKGLVDLFPLGPGHRLLKHTEPKPEPEEPKKVIHRRIILD